MYADPLVCSGPGNAFSLLVTPSLAVNNYTLTESQIQQIEKDWESHGRVLKQDFWANSSSTGRTAIKGAQKLFCSLGYQVSIDGSFGPSMNETTKKFQRDQGLSVDGIIGRGTFTALAAEVRAKQNSSTIKDLKISAPSNVTLKPGTTSTIDVTFSGLGIDQVSDSVSGTGLSASFKNSSWKAYPATCSATINVTASSAFQSGSVTFNLVNKTQGIIKSQTITVKAPASSTYNANAVLADAKKDLGKTGKQLGYNTAWCAYYVSDVLRDNGVKITRAANPRDLVINALNAGLGTYYSFRTANTNNLKKSGLNRSDLVVNTSRNNVTPRAGDIVIYLWEEDVGTYNWSHTGFVESFNGTTLKTIEGNTSGGLVAQRSRNYNGTVVDILRLA